VRENLQEVDLVSLKVDSVEEKIWRKVNHPHRNLCLKSILEGMLKFSESFKGKIITETMLIKNINDGSQNIKKVADFLAKLKPQVECLIGYEGNAFAFTGEVEEDILSITSVHPMREEALKDFLKRAKSDWSAIDRLIKQGKLVELEYKGHKFYIRKFLKQKNYI